MITALVSVGFWMFALGVIIMGPQPWPVAIARSAIAGLSPLVAFAVIGHYVRIPFFLAGIAGFCLAVGSGIVRRPTGKLADQGRAVYSKDTLGKVLCVCGLIMIIGSDMMLN